MRPVTVGASLLVAAAIMGAHISAATAEPSEIQFTSSAAEATLKAEILMRFPGASFPAVEGRLCPETYTGTEGAYSICYAEFRTGAPGTWKAARRTSRKPASR